MKAHRDVLAAIDEKIIRGVKDAALKTHVDEVRGHAQMHLQKAEEIRQGLTSTTTTPPAAKR